ncbi:MAG: MaoC family dehydratase [Caulobacteraceae bacterium]
MDAASPDSRELTVGQSAERLFAVTDEAVRAFAAVSGDHNPVHLDEDFAHRTVFRGRVAHGMLLGAHISAVLGEQLPGPGAIYLSQTLQFEHPVRIGAEVKVRVEVKAIDAATRRVTLATVCTVGDQVVAEGEAVVIPPRARKARPAV